MEQIQYSTSSSEYAQAMRSIRAGKNIFWLVVVLAILIQISCFVLVHLVKVHAEINPSATHQVTMGPAMAWTNWASWSLLLHWVMPATKFFGAVASILLSLSLGLGVMIALLGRRPGMATMISAFFWSLILLAALTPWQQVFGSSFASGALYNFDELKLWVPKGTAIENQILFYGRFLTYPVLALLLAIVVQIKFAIASRAISGMPTILMTTDRPAASASST